jgi:ankyrin repeat protein
LQERDSHAVGLFSFGSNTLEGCIAVGYTQVLLPTYLLLLLLQSLQASKGFVSIMRLLIKAGAKVNAKDKTGSTPLHRAASAGKYDTAVVLVEEGQARLDSHDKTGSTPLLVAVSCKESNIAIYLASKGADLEVRHYLGSCFARLLQQFGNAVHAEPGRVLYRMKSLLRKSAGALC